LREVILVAVFGAVGAVCRYAVGSLWLNWPTPFDYKTLTVNVLGCFAIGVVLQLEKTRFPAWAGVAVTVGFLGAFTTFSAFGYQTLRYLQTESYGLALGNVAANLVLGLIAAAAGVHVGRVIAAWVAN